MRLSTTLFIILFFSFNGHSTIYTFHTAGDYNDVSKWNSFPGDVLDTNDTISIEANCYSIELFATEGYLVFAEDVDNISILDLILLNDNQTEFKNDYFWPDIYGSLEYSSNNLIITPNYAFINLSNIGNGFYSNGCPIWSNYNVTIDYQNWGNQDSQFLECMEGYFYNDGNINVQLNMFYLNCDLELSSGTITGQQPFTLLSFNGSITQICTNCVATITNLSAWHTTYNIQIQGQVILNSSP